MVKCGGRDAMGVVKQGYTLLYLFMKNSRAQTQSQSHGCMSLWYEYVKR